MLILSWEIYPIYCGGLGVLVRHLVNELHEQGHEVTVAVPDAKVEYNDKCIVNFNTSINRYLQNPLPIEGLEFNLKKFNLKVFKNLDEQVTKVYPNNTPSITKAYAYSLIEHLQANEYDVIIGMDWLTIPSFQILKNNNISTPFYFYINGTEIDRNYGGKMSKTSRIIHNLEKRFYNQADRIFTVSSVSKKVLVKYLKCKTSKIKIIHNDSEMKFVEQDSKYNNNKKILFLGRLAYQKGLKYLLQAFRKLIKKDREAQLSIVGDGSEIKMIKKYIAKHSLQNKITLVKWLDGEEKRKEYLSSSLFVMPSVSEPFGLTALEAVRLGVPTIASTRCGFTDIVPSTPTFDYKDTVLFASLMYQFINSESDWQNLIDKQKKELKTHNWFIQVQKFVSFL
ncbi:MAG: glycosyltransferase family 4 protein [Patescibacteria group bacterium]